MANPNSRQTLIDFCKRRLGEPVIEVNVDDDQVEDRIDEALQYYQEFHSDATYRTFLKHQVTATDVSNEYITIPDSIMYIHRMMPLRGGTGTGSSMFDIKYQMHINDIADLRNYNGDVAYYEQMQQYLSLLDMQLNGVPQISFSRNQNRVYIHGDFQDKDIIADDYVIFEVYKIVDPSTFTSIWNDMWLKEYSTALIKMQWGQNLIKFEGMQLPGGVIMNGRQIYDDAITELEQLRERIRLEEELPADFFIG